MFLCNEKASPSRRGFFVSEKNGCHLAEGGEPPLGGINPIQEDLATASKRVTEAMDRRGGKRAHEQCSMIIYEPNNDQYGYSLERSPIFGRIIRGEPVHNNLVENAIRSTAIGKKNGLFFDSSNSMQISAIIHAYRRMLSARYQSRLRGPSGNE